jgi:hypothetical protein
LSTSSPAAIRKNRSNFATLMTWLVGPLAQLRCSDHGTMLPRLERTPIDGCQILPLFSAVPKIDPRHGAAAAVALSILTLSRSLRRCQPPPFTLFRTTVLTTGSYVTTMARCSATTAPEKRPSWSPRRSRESMATSSSFTFPTKERLARILAKGWGGQVVREMIGHSGLIRCHALTPSTCSRVHASN